MLLIINAVMMSPNILRMRNIVFALVVVTLLLYANVNVNQVTISRAKIVEYYKGLTSADSEKRRHVAKTTTAEPDSVWNENQNTVTEQITDESINVPEVSVSSDDISPPTTVQTNALASVKPLARDNEVVFPDITNCSKKEYKRQLAKHKTAARANIYVCRKWQDPDPRNTLWPMVLPPSNGSILRTLPIHHHDPEVRPSCPGTVS